MRKPKFEGNHCSDDCPYLEKNRTHLDMSECRAYGTDLYFDTNWHFVRKTGCVNEHGRDPLWKNIKGISQLKRGDTVRVKADKFLVLFVITDVHDNRATAVNVVDITDPTLWEILSSED